MRRIARRVSDNPMDWLSDLVKEISREWPIVTAAPELSVTILTLGLIIGWAAAWLVLKQRLTHHKELVEQYEKAVANKKIARPRSRENIAVVAQESFTIPFKLMLMGVMSFVVFAILLYTIIHTALPHINMAARLQFSPKNFFHDLADTDKPDLLKLHIQFINTGNITARRPIIAVIGSVRSSLASANDLSVEAAKLEDIVKELTKLNRFGPDMDVNSGQVVTVPGLYISKEQLQEFPKGNIKIYVMYSITWEDDSNNGYWKQDLCGFYDGNLAYIHTCGFTPVQKVESQRS